MRIKLSLCGWSNQAVAVTKTLRRREHVGEYDFELVSVPDILSQEAWANLVRALGLSNREADILRCALVDDRTAVIARTLSLSCGTIHTYRDRMYKKVGVASMTQLVARAFAVQLQLELAEHESPIPVFTPLKSSAGV
jgi:DNA-binding NarL/FixJ family response regulator